MTGVIRIDRAGGPEVLRYEDVPLEAPKQGEARIRHTAIGVNYIDVYFRTGLYPPGAYPFTPGMEAAGVIEALGPNETELAVGDRVVYASRPLGAHAQARNMVAERLVKIPHGIEDTLAAAILLKGMTAEYLATRTFPIEHGHTVLVHAAAGGVGSLLCQWAHARGATVIGTVSNDAKAAQARADGCDHPIVYTRESFVDRVREITHGRGVQVVYDAVGRDTFAKSLECLATRGTLASYGQSSGPIGPVDLGALAKGSLFLTRPSLFDYVAKREELTTSAARVFEMVRQEKLKCRIERTYALRDAAQAHRDLEGRKTSGSLVLIP